MNLNGRKPLQDLYNANGVVASPYDLNTDSLIYIKFTEIELQEMLDVKIGYELYEECALIRDELLRRSHQKQ